jgi:hypothetical protein
VTIGSPNFFKIEFESAESIKEPRTTRDYLL